MPEPSRRPTLQRVPPNDPDTESHLLGAALTHTSTGAAALIAARDADHLFYRPAHRHVAAAIAQLHQAGDPTDVGTVIATLRSQGLLDAAGGSADILHHQIAAPTLNPDSALKWADILDRLAHRRRILGVAYEVTEAVYTDTPIGGLVAELHATHTNLEHRTATSWEPINLAAVLAGETPETVPAWLTRTDGQPLLYPGKIHAINGEPEAGKGWIALAAVAEAARAGRNTLYIDLEDTATTLVERLLALGLTPAQILDRVHYLRPTDPLDVANRLQIAAVADQLQPAVAVVDGLAEALAQNGWDENSASDVTAFYEALPRPLARAGAAVIIIDHLVKDRESQGRYARGSTAKLAAVDGAVYKAETVQPLHRGQTGITRLTLTKDRPGWIPTAGRRTVAEARIASGPDGRMVTITLTPPATHSDEPFRPTVYMERVSRALEGLEPQPHRAIRQLAPGKGLVLDQAVAALVREGFLTVTPGPKGAKLYQVAVPFRQADDGGGLDDPTASRYEHDGPDF